MVKIFTRKQSCTSCSFSGVRLLSVKKKSSWPSVTGKSPASVSGFSYSERMLP